MNRRQALVAVAATGIGALTERVSVSAEMVPVPDLETRRYEDLTAAEMVSMEVGVLKLRPEPDQAHRIIQLSLDLEHLISVLPIDPRNITPEQGDRVNKLRNNLAALSGVKVLLHLFGERGDSVMEAINDGPGRECVAGVRNKRTPRVPEFDSGDRRKFTAHGPSAY